ncbi:hypothetical protein V2E25_00430 [Mycoplasmopsis arginini]|uniref:Uncharacterized protein n=1 Tax=Mycoplasmopsis arginini TaxID=2094 RepID=A0ABZ2AM08_MYCAR|nr:hypothetical protein [Mycoplasmopsis arginini]WVN22058.1 hypothetical protein V2E25_00430 [Mycoplasmopsis arginini]
MNAPSSVGKTSFLFKQKIKNIFAVHGPMPLILVNESMISLSLYLANSAK